MSKPSDRRLEDFKRPNVWDEILDRRKEVVEAILTVALHWWTAGQPRPDWLAPRHTAWSRHVHGALQAAGWPAATEDGRGYADGHTDILDDDAAEGGAEQVFVADWWKEFGSSRKSAKELLDIATEADMSFREHATNLGGRAAELGQVILPGMMNFIYDIETDDGLYSLKVVKGKPRRGARVTWALVSIDAENAKSATPTTPTTPSTHLTVKKADVSTSE